MDGSTFTRARYPAIIPRDLATATPKQHAAIRDMLAKWKETE